MGIMTALGLGGESLATKGARRAGKTVSASEGGRDAVYISGGPQHSGPQPVKFSADGFLWMAGGLLTGGRMEGKTRSKDRETNEKAEVPAVGRLAIGGAVHGNNGPSSTPGAHARAHSEPHSEAANATPAPDKPITFSPARRSQGMKRKKKESEREKLTGRKRVG